MSENAFECFTFNAGMEQFGGDVDRFVKFHTDNVQVFLDILSHGGLPPFEMVDRFMSLASSVNKMHEEMVIDVKKIFRKHGCTFNQHEFSTEEHSPCMYVSMLPTFGNETIYLNVASRLNVSYPGVVMDTTVNVTFCEEQYGGRFEGFGALRVKANYLGSDPWFLDGANSDYEIMRMGLE